MKYMTFNSSCAFAGVANMLLPWGVDVEDRQIALGMKLPYLFDWEDGVYSAGPMLQTSKWFNLYLNPLGYAMTETAVRRSDAADFLSRCAMAMLGLRVSQGQKHAVVFVGMENEAFQFINNKWRNSDAPERLSFSREALTERLDDTVMVATIGKAPVTAPPPRERYLRSCQVLERYKIDARDFCRVKREPEALAAAMNSLFRATLLDGITMLELIGQDELAESFRRIQRPFLGAVREGRPVILSEKLDMPAWLAAIDAYIALIQRSI